MRLLIVPIVWMVGVVAFTFFGGMALDGKKLSDRTQSIIFYGGLALVTIACLVLLVFLLV